MIADWQLLSYLAKKGRAYALYENDNTQSWLSRLRL